MLSIWTDGACEPNPGIGGWGWHSSDGRQGIGGEIETTNNRMEMTAILEALKQIPDGEAVTVHSDSQYCVKGLTEWHNAWKQRGWKKKGVPMPNRDLWIALDEQTQRLDVSFKWVRGHNGDEGNEKADDLASQGRLSVIDGDGGSRLNEPVAMEPEQLRIDNLEYRVAGLEKALKSIMELTISDVAGCSCKDIDV